MSELDQDEISDGEIIVHLKFHLEMALRREEILRSAIARVLAWPILGSTRNKNILKDSLQDAEKLR